MMILIQHEQVRLIFDTRDRRQPSNVDQTTDSDSIDHFALAHDDLTIGVQDHVLGGV